MLRKTFAVAVLAAAASAGGSGHAGTPNVPSFGTPLTGPTGAGGYSVAPSGAGLPAGHGSVAEGRDVYGRLCAGCHGNHLEGMKAIGAPALVGGRGTLASATPVKTVESYWPDATTLFDYVRRAMPFNAPGSLDDDQVYAVTAYILAQGHIVAADAEMDAARLPKVRMPNADGFIPDPRPPQR